MFNQRSITSQCHFNSMLFGRLMVNSLEGCVSCLCASNSTLRRFLQCNLTVDDPHYGEREVLFRERMARYFDSSPHATVKNDSGQNAMESIGVRPRSFFNAADHGWRNIAIALIPPLQGSERIRRIDSATNKSRRGRSDKIHGSR